MRIFFFHVLLIGCSLLVRGQRVQMIRMNKFTQRDGLSSFNIRKIIFDKFGFLWVATQDGLNRCDGKNFGVYDKGLSKNSLSGFDVRDLIEIPDSNELMALSATGGIDVINTVTGSLLRSFPLPQRGDNSWNTSFVKSGDILWIGTTDGLMTYDYKRRHLVAAAVIPFHRNQAGDLFTIQKVLRDSYGNIWAFVDNYGVAIYRSTDGKLIRQIGLSELGLPSSVQFNDAAVNGQGRMVIGTEKGMRVIGFDDHYVITGLSHVYNCYPSLYQGQVYSLCPSGSYLFVGAGGGLFRLHKDSALCLRYQDDPSMESWLNSVKTICAGGDGSLWLGCQNGMAYSSLLPPSMQSFFYNKDKSEKLDNVFSLASIDDREFLVGLEHGLKRVNISTGVFRTIDKENSYVGILRIPGREGRYLASNQKGTMVVDGDLLRPVSSCYPEFKGLDNVQYNSGINYGDTVLVLGAETLDGVLIWNRLRHHVDVLSTVRSAKNISSNIVNSLYRDHLGRLWVLSDNIISIYDAKFQRLQELRFRQPSDSSAIPYYFSMCEARGYFWIAAYGTGILQLSMDGKLQKIFSIKDGLCNNGVYMLFNYRDRDLLVTTNNGMSVFDVVQEKFHNFFEEDGLHSNTFEENVAVYADSVLYAGGLQGFSRIEPGRFFFNKQAPQVYFTNIRVQTSGGTIDSSDLLIRRFTIPAERLQTTVGFSALSYPNPSRVLFAYRIKELKGDWVNLGNQHFVNLIGLEPGHYTLEVKAANADGVWSTESELELILLPHWYETGWFRFLVMLSIGGLFYALYRYRLSQIRQQQHIRKSIAGDLHDDLGSTLNALKVYSHLARKEPDKEGHIIQIEESLAQATLGLRDMIWVLDDPDDSIMGLVERIRKFAAPLTLAKGILMEWVIEEESPKPINKTEKRNLLMIAKESINNSIKYSGCQTIKLRLERDRYGFSLTIQDDGIGFDLTTANEGNGLKNIRHRADQIRCSVRIFSFPGGGGTTVEVVKH